MRKWWRYLLLTLFGTALGTGIALYRITHWEGEDATIRNGFWQGQQLDHVGKDPLLTARIAVAAIFALRPDETIYLVAKDDADGHRLSGKYDYRVTGISPTARYWSITLYGEDFFLVPNAMDKFNFNIHDLGAGQDSFSFIISPHPQDGPWLPSMADQDFYLTLRLYHPEKELVDQVATTTLPTIERIPR